MTSFGEERPARFLFKTCLYSCTSKTFSRDCGEHMFLCHGWSKEIFNKMISVATRLVHNTGISNMNVDLKKFVADNRKRGISQSSIQSMAISLHGTHLFFNEDPQEFNYSVTSLSNDDVISNNIAEKNKGNSHQLQRDLDIDRIRIDENMEVTTCSEQSTDTPQHIDTSSLAGHLNAGEKIPDQLSSRPTIELKDARNCKQGLLRRLSVVIDGKDPYGHSPQMQQLFTYFQSAFPEKKQATKAFHRLESYLIYSLYGTEDAISYPFSVTGAARKDMLASYCERGRCVGITSSYLKELFCDLKKMLDCLKELETEYEVSTRIMLCELACASF